MAKAIKSDKVKALSQLAMVSMTSLTNKRILLGVTGGIAAYKSAELVRRLKDAGADVRVVMTRSAQEFVGPLTFQALSGRPVHTDLLDEKAEAAMGHIELARWGDALLVAPASANFIARLAGGEGTDLLSTLCLATRAPILLAPAMNQAMWANTATAENIAALTRRKVQMIGPESGNQACGDIGPGRMSEVPEILAAVAGLFKSGVLQGRKVVITAGPTREALDPVRYISNHSSGKMGYALAEAAMEAGAETVLVSGPVALAQPDRVQRILVESAEEMLAAVEAEMRDADIFIGSAAVADYRPLKSESAKIKKGASELTLTLVQNPDILAKVAKNRAIYVVGFAAETHNVESYACDKLQRKDLDMIVANDVSRSDIGFNSDQNAITVIERKSARKNDTHDERSMRVKVEDLTITEYEEASKTQLARELIQRIAKNTSGSVGSRTE